MYVYISLQPQHISLYIDQFANANYCCKSPTKDAIYFWIWYETQFMIWSYVLHFWCQMIIFFGLYVDHVGPLLLRYYQRLGHG